MKRFIRKFLLLTPLYLAALAFTGNAVAVEPTTFPKTNPKSYPGSEWKNPKEYPGNIWKDPNSTKNNRGQVDPRQQQMQRKGN
jgi:hypothetical protein